MDWTIVVSVLVALLLFPVILAFIGGLVFLTAFTVLRGRVQRLMEGKMDQCKQMFSSAGEATTADGPAAPKGCPPAGC